MPPFTIPGAVPIGDLSSIQSVTPREPQPIPSGIQEEAQLRRQAASLDADTAAITAQTGAGISALSQELIKPLERLRQTREIMQASDIAVKTILESRRKVQDLQASGVPYAEWLPQSTRILDGATQEAITSARRISPAAEEVVTRELLQERLSLLTGVQRSALKEDVQTQLGAVEDLKTFTRDSYFQADTPERRTSLRENYFSRLDLLGQTGALTPAQAAAAKEDFTKFVDANAPLYLAQSGDLVAAESYIESTPSLSPVEKEAARSQLRTFSNVENHARETVRKMAERQMRLAQEATATELKVKLGDTGTPANEIRRIMDELPALVQRGDIDKGDVDSTLSIARKTLERQAEPIPPSNDPKAEAEWENAIGSRPQDFTINDLFNDPRIDKERPRLVRDLLSAQKAGTFYNDHVYRDLLGDIEAVVPSSFLQTLRIDETLKYTVRQRDARLALTTALRRASQDRGFILDSDEIEAIGRPIVNDLRKRLGEIKATSPVGTRPLSSYQ